ncbi:hypothetical protein K1719_024962 [Acacia pycnantha]|nr:hypothetical protein K1719_024962 [Acacia pycnantha]
MGRYLNGVCKIKGKSCGQLSQADTDQWEKAPLCRKVFNEIDSVATGEASKRFAARDAKKLLFLRVRKMKTTIAHLQSGMHLRILMIVG